MMVDHDKGLSVSSHLSCIAQSVETRRVQRNEHIRLIEIRDGSEEREPRQEAVGSRSDFAVISQSRYSRNSGFAQRERESQRRTDSIAVWANVSAYDDRLRVAEHDGRAVERSGHVRSPSRRSNPCLVPTRALRQIL